MREKTSDIVDLFQRIKHDNYELTLEERGWITERLSDPDAKNRLDTHTFVLSFALTSEPSLENISLINRFLADDVDDYVRQAAITCLMLIWGLDNYGDTIVDLLKKIDQEDYEDSAFEAISAAYEYIFVKQDSYVTENMGKIVNKYIKKISDGQFSEKEEEIFLQLANKLRYNYERCVKGNVDYIKMDLDEALKTASKYYEYVNGAKYKYLH